MFGNGTNDIKKPDRLYQRDGSLLESEDNGVAGDEWKQFAQTTDAVWYYSGTELDDAITVDFITEPGLAEGRHLITQLTSIN